MVKKCFSAAFLVLLASCSGDEATDPQAIPWQTSELVGYRYELVDKDHVEQYAFAKDGMVALTTGQKNGPVMGTTYYWSIDKKGVLSIGRESGSTDVRLVKLKSNNDQVTVN